VTSDVPGAKCDSDIPGAKCDSDIPRQTLLLDRAQANVWHSLELASGHVRSLPVQPRTGTRVSEHRARRLDLENTSTKRIKSSTRSKQSERH
jgi:hypothetical protein